MNNILFSSRLNPLSQKSKFKIGISIIIVYTIVMFIISYGNCDAFFPLNIINFTDLIYFGRGIPSNTIGYQSFAAIICILTGLSPTNLLIFPILTIPLVLIITLLVYRISKNMLITGFIVPFILSFYFGESNTSHIIWIHTFGIILFFYIVYLVYLLYISHGINGKDYLPSITICLFLILFSSCIGSYNLLCMTLIFLSVIFSIVFLLQSYHHHISPKVYHSPFRYPCLGIIFILILFTIAYIFLLNSGFLYMFIGFGTNSANVDKISIFEKLINMLSSYFETNTNTSEISSLFISKANPYVYQNFIGIPRYILSIFVFILYSMYIIKLFKKSSHNIPKIDILIISLFLTYAIFILIRIIFIGQLTYNTIFVPFALIFCRMLVSKDKKLLIKISKISITIILVLWIMTSAGTYYNYSSSLHFADKVNTNSGLNAFEKWDELYSNENIVSDVYSTGFLQLLSQINNPSTILHETRPTHFSVFEKHAYILSLINPIYHEQINILINWKLKEIAASTGDWINLKSWSNSKTKIAGNPNYDIVYSNEIISYLRQVA